MLAALARYTIRRRFLVIAAWLLLTIAGAVATGKMSGRWFQSFSIPGFQAYEANQRILKTFGSGEPAPLVTVFSAHGDVTRRRGQR